MSLGRALAVGLVGLSAEIVEVEAHLGKGVPALFLVGLPDAALGEARERVRGALEACGLELPKQRTVVNLSPADLRKNGSGFDLAIAVALMCAENADGAWRARRAVHIGELGLDGRVRPVRGVLPMVVAAVAAGHSDVVVSAANEREAALVPGAHVHAIEHLSEILRVYGVEVGEGIEWEPLALPDQLGSTESTEDLADVIGQPEARRALEVAAAGGHHLLMMGPPGAGKTMLARRLPTLLPDLSDPDAVQVTSIHSIAGRRNRPRRSRPRRRSRRRTTRRRGPRSWGVAVASPCPARCRSRTAVCCSLTRRRSFPRRYWRRSGNHSKEAKSICTAPPHRRAIPRDSK